MSNRARPDVAGILLAEVAAAVREKAALQEPLAGQVAQAITDGLRQRLGGDYHYIPAPDRRVLDKSILEAFNGQNRAEVMRQFGISKTKFYTVLHRGAERNFPDLPLKDGRRTR